MLSHKPRIDKLLNMGKINETVGTPRYELVSVREKVQSNHRIVSELTREGPTRERLGKEIC